MTPPIDTLMRYLWRKYRSRLNADTPSWAARALIRSIAVTPHDRQGDDRWRCARAPVLVRMFRRPRRPDGRLSRRSLLCAGMMFVIALSCLADVRATTIIVKTTLGEIRSICGRAGGDFIAIPGGHSCVIDNCDGQGGRCAVNCNSVGLCTGTMPSSDRVR